MIPTLETNTEVSSSGTFVQSLIIGLIIDAFTTNIHVRNLIQTHYPNWIHHAFYCVFYCEKSLDIIVVIIMGVQTAPKVTPPLDLPCQHPHWSPVVRVGQKSPGLENIRVILWARQAVILCAIQCVSIRNQTFTKILELYCTYYWFIYICIGDRRECLRFGTRSQISGRRTKVMIWSQPGNSVVVVRSIL